MGVLNKGGGVSDYYPVPHPLPEETDEAMEFDVHQFDTAGKRYYGGLGWSGGRSGIDMPPSVSRAEAIATGGSPSVLPERKAKKPATEKKSKKKFLVNDAKEVIEGGLSQKHVGG